MAKSDKPIVIEHIFDQLWDPQRKVLKRTTVTSEDVITAISYCNEHKGTKLSVGNPANFMKDVVRGQNASRNWPRKIGALDITAKQRAGDRLVFEFVSYAPGQTEPFPDNYKPSTNTVRHSIQSVSLPLASKALGRRDEPWLIQVAVNLRIVETHFAVTSCLEVLELNHLQMSVKLRKTEIDAIFSARIKKGRDEEQAIVTCEAKQRRERILVDQIVSQVQAAFEMTDTDMVIPMGMKATGKSEIYIAEFMPVRRNDIPALKDTEQLYLAREAVYQLTPPVRGI